MIKIVKIMFICLLAVSLQAKSNKWHILKPLDMYPTSAFNLKKSVAYLEIRQYQVNEERNKLKKKSYETVLSLYRTPLDSFAPKTVKKFRKLVPNLSRQGDIYVGDLQSRGVGCYYKYNGFMIDDQGKMYSMNMTEDVIGFLGKIDTSAEIQTVLWLHNKHAGSNYRKTSRGYDVLIKYQDEEGDAQTEYCKKYQYKASINTQGKIVRYKLLKTRRTKTRCMHIDWLPCN